MTPKFRVGQQVVRRFDGSVDDIVNIKSNVTDFSELVYETHDGLIFEEAELTPYIPRDKHGRVIRERKVK